MTTKDNYNWFIHQYGPIGIMSLSATGKTYLSKLYPELIIDTDRALDKATEGEFDMNAYQRRRAWRRLCREKPWEIGGEKLKKWSSIRRKYISNFHSYFDTKKDCLILTSEFMFELRVQLYVGIELGKYETHLDLCNKLRDNGQCEAMNNRLEGYSPVIRLKPKQHLATVEPIKKWLYLHK